MVVRLRNELLGEERLEFPISTSCRPPSASSSCGMIVACVDWSQLYRIVLIGADYFTIRRNESNSVNGLNILLAGAISSSEKIIQSFHCNSWQSVRKMERALCTENIVDNDRLHY